MRMPSKSQLLYETVWRPLEKELGADNLEQLFWLDLAQVDDRAKMTDVYSAQVKRLDSLSETEIEAEVRRFASLGRLLHLILEPQAEADHDVRLRLQRLKDWGTTTVRPILLQLLERRERKEATSEQIARAMLYVESFLVRRLLIGRTTMNNNRILARTAVEVRDAAQVDAAVHRYLSTGRKHYATDAEVRDAVGTLPFYFNGRGRQNKLVLQWLEESYGSHEPIDLARATIEHVLPQTLSPQWEAELSDGLDDGEEIADVHAELVHVLGNLTLTGYNGTLGNKPFSEKRNELAKSGIRLSRGVSESQQWGREQILARSASLADRIAEIWPAPTVDVDPTGVDAKWQHVRRAVTAIPAGRWTTYSDLAALVGTAAQPLGNYLASVPLPGAHRVLKSGGWISDSFAWTDHDRHDDPREVLSAEGVRFDAKGRADVAQRFTTEDLADALDETGDGD